MNTKEKLRFAGVVSNKVFVGPKRVSFQITNFCNLKCIYCWHHSPSRNLPGFSKKKELDFSSIKRSIDDCADLGVDWINISGQGEPTLHSRFRDIVSHIKKKKLRLSLLTNGTFSTDILKTLCCADEIGINLSASDTESYRRIQSHHSKEDLFEVVMRNISFFASLKKRRLRAPRIQITFILNSENYKKLPFLLDRLRHLWIDSIYIKNIEPEEISKPLILKKYMMEQTRAMLAKLKPGQSFRNCRIDSQLDYASYKNCILRKDATHVKACYNGWYYAFVNLRGDVIPCCKVSRKLLAGNIHKQSFFKIWASDEFQRIRMDGKKLYHNRFNACLDCCFYQLQHDIHEKVIRFGKRQEI